jgi:NAD(P)-dependent dehydrogenase (short-subunit alcohol dehydrogenase family)
MTQLDFTGRNVVVTGAASGIGRRTAQQLIDAGANVIALDRNEPDLAVARYVYIDLADSGSIAEAVDKLQATVVDGLANIAGVPGTLPKQTVWRVNYLGLKALTEGVLPLMSRGASIVNLASTAGHAWHESASALWKLAASSDWSEAEEQIRSNPALSGDSYRKSKEAVIVWTLGAASVLQRRAGVRLNCVSPGPVQTPILEDFRRSLGEANVSDIVERTGRLATPDDIAPVVLFLLNRASQWIVGADILAEGGLTASRFASSMEHA